MEKIKRRVLGTTAFQEAIEKCAIMILHFYEKRRNLMRILGAPILFSPSVDTKYIL